MRVLVTGGGGFIGSAVKRHLDTTSDEMVTFDHPNDVRDLEAVFYAVAKVDAVIHLAALLGTAETLDSPAKSVETNIVGALNVLNACADHDKPMVQIGTGHRGQLNVYAITKACAEDLALMKAEFRGAKVNVVRAFNAYGPGQKAPPPYGKATVNKIGPAFICAALRGDPLKVFGDGSQIVDLIHVDDIARSLVEALDGPYGRTIDAGTGQPVKVVDAARAIIEACSSTSEIEFVPMRDGEPEHAYVCADEGLPYAMPWPSLDDTIAYYRDMLA